MLNVKPAMMRDAPPELETRAPRRPKPVEMAGGRAYCDPGFRSVSSYVLARGPATSCSQVAIVEDARLDCRAYLARHADRRP
jgi:hypothetical protein